MHQQIYPINKEIVIIIRTNKIEKRQVSFPSNKKELATDKNRNFNFYERMRTLFWIKMQIKK